MSPSPSRSLAVQVMVCGEPTCQVSGGVPLGALTVTLGALRLATTVEDVPMVAAIVPFKQSRSRRLVMVTVPGPLEVAATPMLKRMAVVLVTSHSEPSKAPSTW